MEGEDEVAVVSKDEFITARGEFLKQGLNNGSPAYRVADDNGEIISHIFIQKIDPVPRPCKIRDQFGYLTNNYTKPQHRNQGIGSKPLRRVTQWAKEQDLELLIVRPSQEGVRFYERTGFKIRNEIMEL